MISELNWESMEERRTKQRLAMLYKIHHRLVAIDKDKYIKQSSRISDISVTEHMKSQELDQIEITFHPLPAQLMIAQVASISYRLKNN